MASLRSGESRGGRGRLGPKQVIQDLLGKGFSAELIREDLKARGYKAPRITNLLRECGCASSSQLSQEDARVDCSASQSVQGRRRWRAGALREKLVEPREESALAKRPRRHEELARARCDEHHVGDEAVPMHRDVADVMSNQLSEQLAGVRRLLRLRAIPGDGSCLFRSVSSQAPEFGYDGHGRLRDSVVAHVRAHLGWYLEFFDGEDQLGQLRRWTRSMAMDDTWGDNVALQAAARLLGRPIAVWRAHSQQRPTVVLPLRYNENDPAAPIYVELDETNPGCEHYSALLLGDGDPQPARVHGNGRVRLRGKQVDECQGAGAPAAQYHGMPTSKMRELVAEVKAGRQSQRALAKQYGVPRQTLSKWSKRTDDVLADVESCEQAHRRAMHGDGESAISRESVDSAIRALASGDVSEHRLERLHGVCQQTLHDWKKKIQSEQLKGPDLEAFIEKKCDDIPEAHNRRTKKAERVRSIKDGDQRQCLQAALAWRKEITEHFGGKFDRSTLEDDAAPAFRADAIDDVADQAWIACASWTFCPKCGLTKCTGKILHTIRRMNKAERNKYDKCGWQELGADAVVNVCDPACDLNSITLQMQRPANEDNKKHTKLQAYVTPAAKDWPKELLSLTADQKTSLAPIDLHCEYKDVRGGKAPTTCRKKLSVVKAFWKKQRVVDSLSSDDVRQAYAWLLANNSTYAEHIKNHDRALRDAADARDEDLAAKLCIPTATLLLQMPGVEIAARPWLYPRASFGDTDIKIRLVQLNRMKQSQTPSLNTSFERKLLSRAEGYQDDYLLQCLLADVSLASKISAFVSIADGLNMAPDEVAAVSQNFNAFWVRATAKLQDMCRQMDAMPNLFFTVAPAEWKFPLPEALLGLLPGKALSERHALLTRHVYHCLLELLRHCFLDTVRAKVGVEEVHEYALRFEFQDRGTMHVHVVAWVTYDNEFMVDGFDSDPARFGGRSGTKHSSPLVKLLESLFNASVDVQCANGKHCLLQYVTGYAAKASDSLKFKSKDFNDAGVERLSKWRQIFRLLSKKAPLEPEMTADFAGLPLIHSSFAGLHIFAPVPGSKAVNVSRHMYNAFLAYQQRMPSEQSWNGSYIEWLRTHKPDWKKQSDGTFAYSWQLRNKEGAKHWKSKDRLAVGVSFAFELLDVFIGQFLAMFVPHKSEQEFIADGSDRMPVNAKFLYSALQHPHFNNDVDKLFRNIDDDLQTRGLSDSRRITFKMRLRAGKMLLDRTGDGEGQIPAYLWSMRRPSGMPERTWSPEQAEVLRIVSGGLDTDDFNMRAASRRVVVTGGPGTGKTEVMMQVALDADRSGCKVLIACPLGQLVSKYKQQLPAHTDIVVETFHASFKITRANDQAYIPPGRLRHYDLIIFDEVSQMDADVWRQVRTALAELHPGPFLCFVGDFQQLQPISGDNSLRSVLSNEVTKGVFPHVELKQHNYARSKDEDLLKFLNHVRLRQPTRRCLSDFLGDRLFSKDMGRAVNQVRDWEAEHGTNMTTLTVTNKAAADFNELRLRADFPEAHARLDDDGVPGEPQAGSPSLVLQVGMRMRLTRNQDKERGFVNGALGVIRHVLDKQTFVLESADGVYVLVHPTSIDRKTFVPASYAYATTMRRVQGATLDAVALYFDRRRPDPGYAYVAASRVRTLAALWHIGRLRTSDWAPVGSEQGQPGDDSMSTDSEEAGYYAMSDASSSEGCPDDEGDAFAIQVGMAGGAGALDNLGDGLF